MSLSPEAPGGSANDARAVWAVHVSARKALVEATALLDREGIPSLAVKGAVTAYTLYDAPTDRPLGDVDLRVRPSDVARAARAFADEGWSVADWKPAYGAFVAQRGTVAVDVESVLGAPGLCALPVETMLGRAARGPSGLDALVPELHDHALVITMNVFKDKLTLAFPWAVEDALRIVEAPGFDARRFAALARSAKVTGLTWIVADWFVRHEASAGWRRVQAELGGARAPRPLYARAMRWLHDHRDPESLATRLVSRVAADDPSMWLPALRAALALERTRGRRGGF